MLCYVLILNLEISSYTVPITCQQFLHFCILKVFSGRRNERESNSMPYLISIFDAIFFLQNLRSAINKKIVIMAIFFMLCTCQNLTPIQGILFSIILGLWVSFSWHKDAKRTDFINDI